MTIEDGFLLLEEREELERQIENAQHRLQTHFQREAQRRESGLTTDLERYLNGKKIND